MPQTSVDFSPATGLDGLVDLSQSTVIQSCVCDEANGIPFGRAVVLKAGATKTVDLPVATGESAAAFGVAVRDNSVEANSSGSGVFADGDGMSVVRDGVITVKVEDAVVAGATPFIRFSAGASLTELGRFRSDDGDEGGGALASARAGWEYLTSASAGGYARVWVVR